MYKYRVLEVQTNAMYSTCVCRKIFNRIRRKIVYFHYSQKEKSYFITMDIGKKSHIFTMVIGKNSHIFTVVIGKKFLIFTMVRRKKYTFSLVERKIIFYYYGKRGKNPIFSLGSKENILYWIYYACIRLFIASHS